MKCINTKYNRGFTLVEMLVSISLFTIVVTMSVGTLLILIDANARVQSTQLVVTNLTFALDSMTREIRTGFNWYCGSSGSEPTIPEENGDLPSAVQDCANGNYLSIVESFDNLTEGLSSSRITYWFDADHYGTDHGALLRKLGKAGDGEWLPLTSEEIIIDDVKFVVTGSSRLTVGADSEQPNATLFVKGRAGVTDADSSGTRVREFDLETTVTQRLLDL